MRPAQGGQAMTRERASEAGFSLTELLVAMLVTMVVSGAVFGLMAAGQGAFRREPELTDRQQNIRIAMNMIQRDIETAGAGMNQFEQAFTRGDGVNEAAPLVDGVGPNGASNLPFGDILEVKGADPNCTAVPVSAGTAGIPGNVTTMVPLPQCFAANTMVAILMPAGAPGDPAMWAWSAGNAPGGTTVNFPAQPAKSEYGAWAGATPASVMPIQLARYAIANDADGMPALWRSATGGLDIGGNRVPPGPAGAAGSWQLIARGIEDMQIRYRVPGAPPFPNAACCGTPPLAVAGNFATLVQEVEVTLWARTLTPSALQGQTTRGGVTAIHGMLRTVTTPRAVLMAMKDAVPPLWQ
jgi:type II secretory pathway pseudopilin PulG